MLQKLQKMLSRTEEGDRDIEKNTIRIIGSAHSICIHHKKVCVENKKARLVWKRQVDRKGKKHNMRDSDSIEGQLDTHVVIPGYS